MSTEARSSDERALIAAQLLDRAPCGFLSFGEDGVVEHVNRTLLDMLGFEPDEIIGGHVERIFTVGTRIFYQTHWFPLLRLHHRADEIFLMLRTKGGADIGVLANAVRHERRNRTRFDCVLMQVKERAKYEDELLRARRAAERARADVEAQRSVLEEANVQLEAQAIELELRQEQMRAQAMELEAAGEELRAANEQLIDRSVELESARAAAEEANEAKSRFLAVMSHELRTPLNAISGYVELLDIGIYGAVNDAQKDALGRISRSQRHLLRLINDVLNLARIEAGHVEYAIGDVPVEQVINDVSPMVEPQMTAKELSFELHVEPDLTLRADREKVQQILLNLLSNAIKFTPAGGRVTLAASRDYDGTGQVSLTVADTGIGIAEEKVATVFEPFVQVDVSEQGRKQGTGLGLAISRDLARGMGGDLCARSAPGKGSTFTLTLPPVARDD